jgi:hypothetical protein
MCQTFDVTENLENIWELTWRKFLYYMFPGRLCWLVSSVSWPRPALILRGVIKVFRGLGVQLATLWQKLQVLHVSDWPAEMNWSCQDFLSDWTIQSTKNASPKSHLGDWSAEKEPGMHAGLSKTRSAAGYSGLRIRSSHTDRENS